MNGITEKNPIQAVCEQHGEYTSVERSMVIPLSDRIHDMGRSGCPECSRLREDARKREEAAAEAKAAQDRLERVLGSSGIPRRYMYKNFDSFVADTEEKQRALAVCKKYAGNFEDVLKNGASMIMSGGVGTGKTHLACSIANEIIKAGRTAHFTSVRKAIKVVRAAWNSKEQTEEQAIQTLTVPDLLILDEVGVQSDTDNEKLILMDILNERYEQVRPTILISNLPMTNSEGPSIQAFLGDRIIDRFRELGGPRIVFSWGSYRGSFDASQQEYGEFEADKRKAGISSIRRARHPLPQKLPPHIS